MSKFAIIDVETTGGSASSERITEIAIVLHDGSQVLDTYSTLLNPERSIPYNITQITGITQAMVENAPKFYEVAKKIVLMTEGAIFVAHNVRFDYEFVREEFKRLGFTYTRKQLCTVRLARQAIPGLRSYSLENLIKHLDIKVNARHRALDDTLATVELFEKILAIERGTGSVERLVNQGIKENNLPEGITLEKLHSIPDECGVYYLHDAQGEVIYVGKSINIRKRVMDHFADHSDKGVKMRQGVADISYELTGSEIAALLLESHEIKRLRPRINKAQRAKHFPYAIYHYKDEKGFFRLGTAKNVHALRQKMPIIAEYEKLNEAKARLKGVVRSFELCPQLGGVENSSGACFHRQIEQCRGACCGEEHKDTYNERAQEAIESLSITFVNDFFLLDEGRSRDERTVVLVENNRYKGFGYFDSNEQQNEQSLRDAIQKFDHNPEVLKIIRLYLHQQKKGVKLVTIGV